jgi:general L-amino acid transport system permease protein
VFILQRLDFFIYGFYPDAERWRVDVMFLMLAAVLVPQFIPGFPARGRTWLGIFGLTLYPVITGVLLLGGLFGLPFIETGKWGGLMLTLVLSYVGIVAALPIGILLALGRRSSMPVIRTICVIFIELWRGVPLISVLFMASVMLPLFLPEGVNFDKLLRALIGIVMFQSAYMAEVIRGGLQGIPKGQYEAASALGLGYWRSTALIILPQALKMVIPGIVNTFIALFKDTTLVLIIGLFDILGTVQAAIVDPAWGRVAVEGYVFAAFCFWVFCFGMSRYSQGLEKKLHTGHKR